MTRRDAFESAYPGHAIVPQLPLWPESKRGAPNTFLRSALFAATQGHNREYLKAELLASLQGFTVTYTGERLTQTDLDVWEALTHLARIQPLGTECTFTAHGLLRAMGRDTGKSQHDWLRRAMLRLTACAVEIKFERRRFFGSLIESGINDEVTNAYRVKLNPTLIQLFGENQWTRLDWAQRRSMQKQPLAQWLHAYWSTHATPLPIKVDTLHRLTGSSSKHLRNFRLHLRAALEVLVGVGFITEYSLEPGEGVRVRRARKHEGP